MHLSRKNTLPLAFAGIAVGIGALILASIAPLAYAQGNAEKSRGVPAQLRALYEEHMGEDSFMWHLLPYGLAKKVFGYTPGSQGDHTAPIIENIDVDEEETSAILNWSTDEKTSGTVYVSTQEPVVVTDEDTLILKTGAILETEHELTLEDLAASTTYYFIIEAEDENGNVTTGEEMSFITDVESEPQDETAPVISNVAWSTGTSSITVTWDTNEPATGALYGSTTSGFGLDSENVASTSDSDLTLEHSLTLTGLMPDTTYFHRVVSEDAEGNTAQSIQFGITTD